MSKTETGRAAATAFVTGLLGMFLLGANLSIVTGLISLSQPLSIAELPKDALAGLVYLITTFTTALVTDWRALTYMFFDFRAFEIRPKQNTVSCILGLQHSVRRISVHTAVMNWMAALGLVTSALKLSIANRVRNYDTMKPFTPEVAYDLVVGELELNPLLRHGSEQYWEAFYGSACALYLTIYFAISVAHNLGFLPEKVIRKEVPLSFCVVILSMFSGFFAERNRFLTGCMLMVYFFVIAWVCGRAVPRGSPSKVWTEVLAITFLSLFQQGYAEFLDDPQDKLIYRSVRGSYPHSHGYMDSTTVGKVGQDVPQSETQQRNKETNRRPQNSEPTSRPQSSLAKPPYAATSMSGDLRNGELLPHLKGLLNSTAESLFRPKGQSPMSPRELFMLRFSH
eukprot:gnl/TRDRNA2_/TRDRNA2_63547_c0_seq1.p1 gnl/TRDRNA2_/TRDRNA2_63547_c0~~gnl/TRDRNA2_/TRDRNA2_63547_c0_seq1.p1  ORF type:complete len:396 (-),score=38.56 gnl/TRDRNA2_/TRDRNA2_63547_c0_seq1:23-1210(-)